MISGLWAKKFADVCWMRLLTFAKHIGKEMRRTLGTRRIIVFQTVLQMETNALIKEQTERSHFGRNQLELHAAVASRSSASLVTHTTPGFWTQIGDCFQKATSKRTLFAEKLWFLEVYFPMPQNYQLTDAIPCNPLGGLSTSKSNQTKPPKHGKIHLSTISRIPNLKEKHRNYRIPWGNHRNEHKFWRSISRTVSFSKERAFDGPRRHRLQRCRWWGHGGSAKNRHWKEAEIQVFRNLMIILIIVIVYSHTCFVVNPAPHHQGEARVTASWARRCARLQAFGALAGSRVAAKTPVLAM